jgi:Rps23 Pro-64 3,4-dihydroxylase Tpa1-like proline 4-hydroxylase
MKNFINPEAFSDIDSLTQKFESAVPFPHVVIDNFLRPEIADRIHHEVRKTAANVNASNDVTQRGKVACTDWDLFEESTVKLMAFFNSASFIRPLEKITGIDGVIGDPWLEGGGIHQTWRGGFLKMHTDFNWHAKLRADRRINILLYLNKDWRPEYGGDLIIQRLGKADERRSISPIFNRLVIFNTNDTTLHGHPRPLEFPEDYPRTSIALYFYSAGLPVPERLRRKATTTRYLPLKKGDIDLKRGSLRARLGYLVRRFTRL